MKSLISGTRFAVLPAIAMSFASCKSDKDADANPYASNPYYGPSTTGTGYDNSSDGGYVAPAPATGGYTAPAPAPSAPAAPSYSGSTASAKSHTVGKGDTLYNISRRYGTTVTALKSANGLNTDLIRLGQTLSIPM